MHLDLEASYMRDPEVVVIGGGTGTANLLGELKYHTENITAVVNMSDDGGSSGELVKEHGVMPPGDLRQCAAALSTNPQLADMYNARLSGHPIGNFIIAYKELHHGNTQKAMEDVCTELQTVGRVLPVTVQPHEQALGLRYPIRGESRIASHSFSPDRPKTWLEPEVSINPSAEDALFNADLIAIAPGHLYGSILPTLAVRGIHEAFRLSDAKKVLLPNLVNQPGQTDGWHVVDYIKEVERYVGRTIDTVLYNNDVSKETLEEILVSDELTVDIDQERFDEITATAVGKPLLSKQLAPSSTGDHLIGKQRNKIRHDPKRLARFLMELI